jgi:hypothetical protein
MNHLQGTDQGKEYLVYQDVPVYGGEALTLSGMVLGNFGDDSASLVKDRAFLRLEYYEASNQIIPNTTVETAHATGNVTDFTLLTCLATAPSDTKYVRVSAVLDGVHSAYFDSIKLTPRNTET